MEKGKDSKTVANHWKGIATGVARILKRPTCICFCVLTVITFRHKYREENFNIFCCPLQLVIPRSSQNLEMKAFEKFENAVFFKIFEIPSDRQLILVSNLTKIFFKKKFQQLWSLELSKILAEMGRCGRAN